MGVRIFACEVTRALFDFFDVLLMCLIVFECDDELVVIYDMYLL